MDSLLLYCPHCHERLRENEIEARCEKCLFRLKKKDGVFVNETVVVEKDKSYYDSIYTDAHGQKWVQGLNRKSILKQFLEFISLSYRRERFFKKHLQGKGMRILDVACGAGRDYFAEYGSVVGVDLSFEPLTIAKHRYACVLQSGATNLPFADGIFDYVVSSDFFGHVREQDKDAIIKEMSRVLKPGGKTIHIIETDSSNYWFRFAHRFPDLFKKYFIEQIGGHVGLELPSACVARFERAGFKVSVAEKIWGLIWPIQDYASLFNNEYKEKSVIVRMVVALSNWLSAVKLVQVGVNIFLNPLNLVVEYFTSLDHSQGLMLVAEKPLLSTTSAISVSPYSFSNEPTGTHQLLLNEITPESTVLDVGAADGYLGESLIIQKKCRVFGIEPHAQGAAEAVRKGYVVCVPTSVEEALKDRRLKEEKFDYILAGDVCEHLLNPEQVLRTFKTFLKPGGKLVISLPNVAHYSVRAHLLCGRWDMQDAGILDRTHLHFYTQKTARALLAAAGWQVERVRPRGDLERWGRKVGLEMVGRELLFRFPNWWAVQFIFVATSS